MTTLADTTRTIISTPAHARQSFDALDIDFGKDEQADKPITELPRLYWYNGLPTDGELSAIGLHLKARIHPVLDETLEAMRAEGMDIQQYQVQHRPDKDGNSEPKPCWRLRNCSLVIVAQKAQSKLEMSHSEDRQGIAYAWGSLFDEQGHPEIHKRGKNIGKQKIGTTLRLRAFVHELYLRGFYEWLPLTVSGFTTDSLLKALEDQSRVLEYYSSERRAEGKNPFAPFYLFSIPIGAGPMKSVGEPPDVGKIYPVISQIPTVIDRAYLDQHLIPVELIEQIRGGLLSETKVWSMEESKKIASGGSRQQALLEEGTSPVAPRIEEKVSTPEDPLVAQPQLTWIVRTHCHSKEEEVRKMCTRFNVSSPEQLRISHFRILVKEAQSASSQQ